MYTASYDDNLQRANSYALILHHSRTLLIIHSLHDRCHVGLEHKPSHDNLIDYIVHLITMKNQIKLAYIFKAFVYVSQTPESPRINSLSVFSHAKTKYSVVVAINKLCAPFPAPDS